MEENGFVVDTGIEFGNKQNLVSVSAQAVDNLPVDIFVRDDLHTGTFSTGYVTFARSTSAAKAMAARIPSVVRRGCSDRIWVRRFSRCQLVQDQLNRDPGPGKAGFAHHDLGVGDD